jgi:NADH-quinone oxidoreductase subunit J
METTLFYLFGVMALIAAVSVISFRRVFYAALALIVCLSSLAVIYLLLDAPFIAAVQIIIYAGAIMVMFLFVIMLLDPFAGPAHVDKKKCLVFAGIFLGTATLLIMVPILRSFDLARAPRAVAAPAGSPGSLEKMAQLLFKDYLLPFEVTSVLILIAIIGAVVLAKRENE